MASDPKQFVVTCADAEALFTTELDPSKVLQPDGLGGTTWGLNAPPSSHAIGGGSHSASTIAQINTKVSDGDFDDVASRILAISNHTAIGDAHHDKSHAHDGADGSGTVAHADATGQTVDDHHDKSHLHDGIDGSGTVAHVDTTGQTVDDHHDKSHAHDGADGSGTVAHSDTTGRTVDDHHARDHALSHVDGSDDIRDATASLKGLATAAQITKLDAIAPPTATKAQIDVPMGSGTAPGVDTSSTSPTILRMARHRGSTEWGPLTNFEVVLQSSIGNIVYVDLYDITNGAVIATVSTSSSVPILVKTSTITNMPTTEAVVAIRGYRGVSPSTLTCFWAGAY